MATIKEKTEQALVPIRAELIWGVLVILAIVAAYKIGFFAGKLDTLDAIIHIRQPF